MKKNLKKKQGTEDFSKEIDDSRFQSVKYDPKFLPASKKISKTQIDERFSGLFTDKRFTVVSEKDKFGRKTQIPEENKDMERLYYVTETSKPSKPPSKNPKQKIKKKKVKQKIKDKYYNEKGEFEWNEQSSSEEEENETKNLDVNVWDEEEETLVRNDNSSSKLALVNYDWMNINAEDLMCLFTSLKPKDSVIKQVLVYPSEFGLNQMKKEEKEGPTGIWDKENVVKEKKLKPKKVEKEINQWISKANKPSDFDPIKLRKYEKDRLKYYYAVIECDSRKTAEHIYEECDGIEFELSGFKLDLRFVPESTQFPFEPKERCDYEPVNNKVHNFFNRALNHTNVELTWENSKPNRFDYLFRKNMTDEDWDKVDVSKIIGDIEESQASDQEEKEINNKQDEDKFIRRDNTDWRSDFDKKNKRRDQEMEIRFTSGFSEFTKKLEDKKKEKEETTWDKYLKKKKEVKKMRKEVQKKKMKEEDYFVEPEIDERNEKKYKEELELLVEADHKKDFEVNVKEDRFKAIFEDSRYGIDPTHKDFTIEGSGKYLKEVVERRKNKYKK